MADEQKCPVCGKELGEAITGYICNNPVCDMSGLLHNHTYSDEHRSCQVFNAETLALARATRQAAVDAAVKEWRTAREGCVEELDELMAKSAGVYGLHLNGDPAPWDEIDEGGSFMGWLTKHNAARALLKGGGDGK